MNFIGIDPGLSGAIAVIDEKGSILLLKDFPYVQVDKPYSSGLRKGQMRKVKKADLDTLQEIFVEATDLSESRMFCIEHVHPRPGEGVVSTWSFASAYWTWMGMIAYAQAQFINPVPQVWKKTFKEFKKLPKDKASSLVVVKKLFPTADIKFKYHHGRADALLIAEYARLQYVANSQVHVPSI
jgi:hypothetical protein